MLRGAPWEKRGARKQSTAAPAEVGLSASFRWGCPGRLSRSPWHCTWPRSSGGSGDLGQQRARGTGTVREAAACVKEARQPGAGRWIRSVLWASEPGRVLHRGRASVQGKGKSASTCHHRLLQLESAAHPFLHTPVPHSLTTGVADAAHSHPL